MAKNIKALTDNELKYINDNYLFELKDDVILVSFKGYNRRVVHDIDKQFSLNTAVRLIKINPQAIDLWIKKYKDTYSLIEVQAALNQLVVTYQDLNDEDIERQLKEKHEIIK